MLNIIVIARQNDEIMRLCSEINRHGFQCSITNVKDAREQVIENTASLLLIEFTGSAEIEALCRYFRQEKGLPVIALAPLEKLDSSQWFGRRFYCQTLQCQRIGNKDKTSRQERLGYFHRTNQNGPALP